MDGKSTTILKHIGMMKEDELEVFVDVLDDKVGPSVVEDKALTLLPPVALPPHSRSNVGVETMLLAGEAHRETSIVTSVHGLKSSTRRKTQQNCELETSFNLWRRFSKSSCEDSSKQGSSSVLPSFASPQ